MKHLIACAALLSLAGCAPQIKAGNAVGGIVQDYTTSHGAALKAAEAHCKKYGKAARVSGVDEWNSTVAFDCVTP